MTRQECEQKILDLIDQIRSTIHQYNPEIKQCNMCFINNYSTAFALEHDEKGESIVGNYLLNATKFDEEG